MDANAGELHTVLILFPRPLLLRAMLLQYYYCIADAAIRDATRIAEANQIDLHLRRRSRRNGRHPPAPCLPCS